MSPQVVPSFVGHLAGHVEGPPEPGNWHACIAEWAAALRSVEQAEETYQIIELGCGWGCWLNNMGVVAVRKGLRVQLVGVEGNRRHVDDAEATLALNGFNKGDWRIVNGIAAAKHGTAFFPIVEHHAEVWGSQAIFFPEENEAQALRSAGKYSELRCITLADISGGAITDLLHIDIQGAEVDFVVGNIEEMRRSVKRCLIGTHSREIDGMLFAKFLEAGWKLEVERPAIHEIVDGHPEIRIDGVQLWRNPALTH